MKIPFAAILKQRHIAVMFPIISPNCLEHVGGAFFDVYVTSKHDGLLVRGTNFLGF